MAIGRVKDSTLKVFGNDYPTRCVADTFCVLIFDIFVLNPKYRDGTCVRDYLHIMDLASGHLLALDALAPESTVFASSSEAYFKAYNLGKGRGMSVLQIVEAMRKATGFDFKYEIIGRRCGFILSVMRPFYSCSPLDVVTCPISLPIHPLLSKSLDLGHRRIWKPCAGIYGTGKPKIHWVMETTNSTMMSQAALIPPLEIQYVDLAVV